MKQRRWERKSLALYTVQIKSEDVIKQYIIDHKYRFDFEYLLYIREDGEFTMPVCVYEFAGKVLPDMEKFVRGKEAMFRHAYEAGVYGLKQARRWDWPEELVTVIKPVNFYL